eukprot:TRINITY_DN1720_c0_g1_i1.p1 TRINITY_DN1720_c0_g1~~TRINITY_DN1720_c0_g1_i1.p1  ORF type:complete len:85 (+),score=27.17 TRINITY_DN1720_c0_g1_i1:483-737(+)
MGVPAEIPQSRNLPSNILNQPKPIPNQKPSSVRSSSLERGIHPEPSADQDEEKRSEASSKQKKKEKSTELRRTATSETAKAHRG